MRAGGGLGAWRGGGAAGTPGAPCRAVAHRGGAVLAVSSGSVTVNADSSVQLLAEEVASMDMLDLAVSTPSLSHPPPGAPLQGCCASLCPADPLPPSRPAP